MNDKLKFILIVIAIIIILIIFGWFLVIKGSDEEIPLPIKAFTVCQGNSCVDTDTINLYQPVEGFFCLDTEENMTFCGAFNSTQNK